MRLKRPVIACALGCLTLLGGCVPDDEAARQPSAKAQKIYPDKGTESDSANSRDQRDQKAVDVDEATSRG